MFYNFYFFSFWVWFKNFCKICGELNSLNYGCSLAQPRLASKSKLLSEKKLWLSVFKIMIYIWYIRQFWGEWFSSSRVFSDGFLPIVSDGQWSLYSDETNNVTLISTAWGKTPFHRSFHRVNFSLEVQSSWLLYRNELVQCREIPEHFTNTSLSLRGKACFPPELFCMSIKFTLKIWNTLQSIVSVSWWPTSSVNGQ